MSKLTKAFAGNWRFFFILLIPIIFLFVPFVRIAPLKAGEVVSYESLCLYMVIIMALLWLVNALPLVVTAVIPLGLVPLFGIATAKEFANNYMKEPTMMAFGSFMVACAFLIGDLHKRLALFLMGITGNSTTRIVTAIFVLTVLLSMFLTNIGAALVMVATAAAFVDERENVEDIPEDADADAESEQTATLGNIQSTFKIREARDRSESRFSPGTHRAEFIAPAKLAPSIVKTVGTPPATPPNEAKQKKKKDSKKIEELLPPPNPVVDETTGDDGVEVEFEVEKGEIFDEEETEEQEGEVPETTHKSRDEPITLNLVAREDLGKKLKKQFYITVYVAANIGGLFLPHSNPLSDTLYIWTDSRKNKLIIGQNQTKGAFDLSFRKNGQKEYLNLGNWIVYMLPIILILAGAAWFYLEIVFTWAFPIFPNRSNIISKKSPVESKLLNLEQNIYRHKYNKLGKITFHQIAILTLTTLLFFFLILRDPRCFSGWARHVPRTKREKKEIQVKAGNSVGTILIVCLMFMIPRLARNNRSNVSQAILGWKFLEAQVLWGVLLLLGGCFALSQAVHQSGLSILPLKYFNTLAKGHHYDEIHIVSIFMAWACGELISGLASVNIFVQIFALLSRYHTKIGYACMPLTAICGLGFMLPMATPTNAIVFAAAAGDLQIIDMIKYGAFLDFISLNVVISVHFAYGNAFYDKS